jgi:iron-sulfur cluster assembly protein
MITVTSTAGQRIRKNLTQRGKGMGIRLGVRTTGCSGFAYVLEYVDALNPEDTAFEQDGLLLWLILKV